MPALRRVSFLIEDFPLLSPAQQLLDRFLIGFPQDGAFTHLKARVRVWAPGAQASPLLQRRTADHGLEVASSLADAVSGADALVLVGEEQQLGPKPDTIRQALQVAAADTPVFVYGLPASTPGEVTELVELAAARGCPLWASTAVPYGFLLPPVTIPANAPIVEMMAITQGRRLAAELEGLETLLPMIPREQAADAFAVRRLRVFENDSLWHAGDAGLWSWRLLSSAISRSDTPQGNALKDGRPEDLVRLGLVQQLARNPRGWVLEHGGGLRTALLVLPGVVADINVAAALSSGQTVSAQLFRTARPQQEEYSRLAAALMSYFAVPKPPWGPERVLVEARIVAAMQLATDTWVHVSD